jgi:GTP cyclohydrolase II
MSDESVRLALRVHDEVDNVISGSIVTIQLINWQCNGSDVFGSDICTCRPYLIFGIEEAVKEAQKGGSGVVIYFRKEGRALGEVTKVNHSLESGFTDVPTPAAKHHFLFQALVHACFLSSSNPLLPQFQARTVILPVSLTALPKAF